MEDAKISAVSLDPIMVIGKPLPLKKIEISHAYIQTMLGVALDSEFVIKILQKLEFGVEEKREYTISRFLHSALPKILPLSRISSKRSRAFMATIILRKSCLLAKPSRLI